MADDSASRKWMTYSEIRDTMGLPSVRAAEARAHRSRWERRLGNDGKARVAVPLSVLEEPPPQRRGTRGAAQPPQDTQAVNAVLAELRATQERELADLKASHEQLVGELRRRAEAAEGEAARLRAEAAAREAWGLLDRLRRALTGR